ncbi:DUF6188 family protein [Frondihabitans australicus]|uniref:Uncharacterized protein n=1 Tax=Frondihabitans australicus TaxID=386892 RepID=A0A495IIM7_9MICO|nr:DUF6188 family protein [Frondihabitans australicus]RKR74965.1 hypothetical protein C8E83_2099 [Frondihabitans australicus]
MRPDEHRVARGWRFDVTEGTVTLVAIDFALSLDVFVDLEATLRVRIESAFEIESGGTVERVEWSTPAGLGRFADLYGVSVSRIDVDDVGVLGVALGDGRVLRVIADGEYEAFEVGPTDGSWLLVGSPGGGVAQWSLSD